MRMRIIITPKKRMGMSMRMIYQSHPRMRMRILGTSLQQTSAATVQQQMAQQYIHCGIISVSVQIVPVVKYITPTGIDYISECTDHTCR